MLYFHYNTLHYIIYTINNVIIQILILFLNNFIHIIYLVIYLTPIDISNISLLIFSH